MDINTMKTLINRLNNYRYDNGQLSILYSWLGMKLFVSNDNAFNDFMNVKNHYMNLMTGSALIRYVNMHKVPQNSKVNDHLNQIISWIKNHSANRYYNHNNVRYTYGLYRIIRENNHTTVNEASQRNLLDFVRNLYPKYFYQKNLDSKTNMSATK